MAAFCVEGESYIDALDAYGMIFDESAPTVGDLREGVDPLLEAGDRPGRPATTSPKPSRSRSQKVAEAEEEARLAAEEAAAAGDEAPSTTSTSLVTVEVSDDTLAEVEAAEESFAAAIEGVDDSTPLADADVAITSAAYALEVNWIVLLLEAGCVEDEGSAIEQIRSIVAATQTDLTTAGYYTGPVDGVYGPATADAVEALQAANDLPETGYLDPLSQEALAEELEGRASAQVSAIQGVLAAFGFYNGPIDGQWTPEVEAALKAFQAELGVPQTGVVDDATLRAFQDRLAEASIALDNSTSTTTAPPTTEAPTTSTSEAEG